MTDKRGRRAWIKVQLADSPLAHQAAAIVLNWKAQRQAAVHLIRAVRLYAALCLGDTSLLEEYFPGLTLTFGNRPTVTRRAVAPVIVSVAATSEEDDLDDALSGLGLDHLDFSEM